MCIILLCLIFLFNAVKICFSACGTTIGYGDPSLYISVEPSSSGYGIIAEIGYYEFSCCAVIQSWEFYAIRGGELHLMVWRKSGTTYTLVGKNVVTVPSGAPKRKIKYPIRELDRISVMDGDFIGWYTPGSEIIPYSTDVPHNFRMTTTTAIEEGNTFDWSSVGYTHDRAYAIQAITVDDTAPFFTNLQREIVIYDDEPINVNFYRVTYYNGDSRDTITWSYTSTNENITFNTATETVYLTATPSTGTYTMSFTIIDSCSRSDTKSLTIHVLNLSPWIANLPGSVLLPEDSDEGRLLFKLEVFDRQSNDQVVCSLQSVDPNIVSAFAVTRMSGSSDYGIFLLANAPFDYEVSDKHTFEVSCTDGKNTAASGRFVVYLQKNQPPQFLNLPASVELDAASTFLGDLVYTIQMTDAEGDTLLFSMTTEPAVGPFEIKDYGDIIITSDMSEIFVPGYDLQVSVSDGRTQVGPRSLSIQIKNLNDRPVISNLPLPYYFYIEENANVGTTLYHVRVRDLDIEDNHYIYGAFNPKSGSSYFTITSDGYLLISFELDYESIPSHVYQITVTVTDNKDTATGTISIIIIDENEVPVFHQTGYSVEQDEASQNIAFPSAGFIIDDPDANDPKTYWLDCGNDTWRFSMDSLTGVVSYAYDYDLDILLTTQYSCLVRGKDSGFNTCTSSLIINIKDMNDNPPYFNQTQYAFYITPYETVGTQIGNVTAYDIDLLELGSITYKLDMSAFTKLYIQIFDNGTLYVNELLNTKFYFGDVMTLTLTAIDYGGLQTSVTIWLIFEEVNTTTTSTTPIPFTFTNSPDNSLWFTALGVLCFCIFLGSLYFGARYLGSINLVVTSKKQTKISKEKDIENVKLKSVDIEKPAQNPLFKKKNATEKTNINRKVSFKSAAMTVFNVVANEKKINNNADFGNAKNSQDPSRKVNKTTALSNKETYASKPLFSGNHRHLYKTNEDTPMALEI